MPMNTIKINANGGFYSGTGSFLFYKKAATGVVNTDVDVFLDNLYYATMAPTDSIVINRQFQYVRLVPADAANFATFISAESGEEYRTAAVAGVVSVSGGTLSGSEKPDGRVLTDLGKSFRLHAPEQSTAHLAGAGASTTYLANRLGAVDSIFVSAISIQLYEQTSFAPVSATFRCGYGTHTDNTLINGSGAGLLNLNTGVQTNADVIAFLNGFAPSGAANISSNMFCGITNQKLKFESPIKIAPGQYFNVSVWAPATTNAKFLFCHFEISK